MKVRGYDSLEDDFRTSPFRAMVEEVIGTISVPETSGAHVEATTTQNPGSGDKVLLVCWSETEGRESPSSQVLDQITVPRATHSACVIGGQQSDAVLKDIERLNVFADTIRKKLEDG